MPGAPELPNAHLRLVIADAIIGGMKEPFQPPRPITEDEMVDRLWREDASTVRHVFREIASKRAGVDYYRARDPLKVVSKTNSVRKRAPRLTRNKIGLPVAEVARRLFMSSATLTALLEHHGFLELAPYGRRRRRLVTDRAFHAEVGHNVTPKNRIAHLEGYGRAMAFPVFYEDKLDDLVWSLDYRGIVKAVEELPTKRRRLAWLLENHGYLPNLEIANLAGCSEVGVKKARARVKVSSCVIVDQKTVTAGEPRTQGQAAHRGQLTGRTIRLPSWASDRDAQGPTEVAEAA